MSGAGQPGCWTGQMAERQDVITFETPPLDTALDITGPLALEIYAASSAEDTDFTAALVDVYPDGYSLLIQEGILRTRMRDKSSEPSAIDPGKVYALSIDLWATSYTVPEGHQLRLEISSSYFPRFARNLNNGAAFGTSDNIEIADQTIYVGGEYPSRLVLPVLVAD